MLVVRYDLSRKKLMVRYVVFVSVWIGSSFTFSGMSVYYIWLLYRTIVWNVGMSSLSPSFYILIFVPSLDMVWPLFLGVLLLDFSCSPWVYYRFESDKPHFLAFFGLSFWFELFVSINCYWVLVSLSYILWPGVSGHHEY